MTRLRDLDAEFVGEWSEKSHRRLPSIEGAQGLMFQCPKCAIGKEYGEEISDADGTRRGFWRGAHHVLCWFTNPRGAPPVPDSADPKPGRWTISPQTTGIDDITFIVGPYSNSVLLTGAGCQWHGFVTNGDAT